MGRKLRYRITSVCLLAVFAVAMSDGPETNNRAVPGVGPPYTLVAIPAPTPNPDGRYIVEGNVISHSGEVLMEGNFQAVYDSGTGELRYLVDTESTPSPDGYSYLYESTVYTPEGQLLETRAGSAGVAYGPWLSFVQSSYLGELVLSSEGSFSYLYNMETGETLFESCDIYYDEYYGMLVGAGLYDGPYAGILWEGGMLLQGDWPPALGSTIFPYGEGFVIGDEDSGYTFVDSSFQPFDTLRADTVRLVDGTLLFVRNNVSRLYGGDTTLLAEYSFRDNEVAGFDGTNVILRRGSYRALFSLDKTATLTGWYLTLARMDTPGGSLRYYAYDETDIYILDETGLLLHCLTYPDGFAPDMPSRQLWQWGPQRLAFCSLDEGLLLDEELNLVCRPKGYMMQVYDMAGNPSPHYFQVQSNGLYDLYDMNGRLLIENAVNISYIEGDRIVLQRGFQRGMMDFDGNWIYSESVFAALDDN